MTPTEKYLWKLLRDRRFEEHKFRRQHPIGTCIVDFYCAKSNLVIGVDGEIHDSNENIFYDTERTKFLESLGLKVIRFSNDEVLEDADRVLSTILTSLG